MRRGLFRSMTNDSGEWIATVEDLNGDRAVIDQGSYEAAGILPYFEDLPPEADWTLMQTKG